MEEEGKIIPSIITHLYKSIQTLGSNDMKIQVDDEPFYPTCALTPLSHCPLSQYHG